MSSTGITRYSKRVPGTKRNWNWSVKFDKTDGYIGISQTHNEPLLEGELKLERVLLSRRQFRALVAFNQNKKVK